VPLNMHEKLGLLSTVLKTFSRRWSDRCSDRAPRRSPINVSDRLVLRKFLWDAETIPCNHEQESEEGSRNVFSDLTLPLAADVRWHFYSIEEKPRSFTVLRGMFISLNLDHRFLLTYRCFMI